MIEESFFAGCVLDHHFTAEIQKCRGIRRVFAFHTETVCSHSDHLCGVPGSWSVIDRFDRVLFAIALVTRLREVH